MESCVFCQVIAGRAGAHIVWRDDHSCAFLDRRPVFKGHVLVVPLEHHATLVELPAVEIQPLFTTAQRIAAAVVTAFAADGSFVAMNNTISQSVPHLHIHVVPRRRGDGLRGFFWPRTKYADQAEMADYARRLSDELHTPRGIGTVTP